MVKQGDLHVDNIDVFCEKGVFSCEQTRQILEHGKKAGMALNFHAEELHLLHSAEVSHKKWFCFISNKVQLIESSIRMD